MDRAKNGYYEMHDVSVHETFGAAIARFCAWKGLREEDYVFWGVPVASTGLDLGKSDLDTIYIDVGPRDAAN